MHAQTGVLLSAETVTHVLYDSRKILHPEGGLFFALNGLNRSGASFIQDAYNKGVRWFVTDHIPDNAPVENAVYCIVPDALRALQLLAAHHRSALTCTVVGITGSVGKTTCKEWLYHVLSPYKKVQRSPKSFNSQLGVALSLLELNNEAEIALIEAGISEPGEMEHLQEMIRPDVGIFTAFGSAHRQHFHSSEEHLTEKLKLFHSSKKTFAAANIPLSDELLQSIHGISVPSFPLPETGLTTGYEAIAGLVVAVARYFGLEQTHIEQSVRQVPQLALRMETFAGINGNTIINDTYNLDFDALREALHYQQRLAGKRSRVVIIGLSEVSKAQKELINEIISGFHVDQTFFIEPGEDIPWSEVSKSIVLIKGSRDAQFEQRVARGRALQHKTVVEINLSAIRHNVRYFRKQLNSSTKLLCMVKASSYGSGAERVATFLQQEGVDYFGVAFADEGVALRDAGITLPILVMNADAEQASTIIENCLEPAIYSFSQLDAFVTALIHRGQQNYPVHLKFDTGMHRLGFDPKDKERVLSAVIAQPEITVKGVYSHLADADNRSDETFTRKQFAAFSELCDYFESHMEYPILRHLLNSEGALHFPEAQFDMIRLGIVLYGYTSDPQLSSQLQHSIGWKSTVSQVKTIQPGESVGYSCTFTASTPTTIAIIPVGYADGFRRSLSNGKGAVYIRNQRCEVVGRVCMDMIMVDVTGKGVQENDVVEIIGSHQDLITFAAMMDTIPYEVMTGMSQRMHRIYIEE